MEVKTDSGCCLIEYDIYISRKVNIKNGNRVYIYIFSMSDLSLSDVTAAGAIFTNLTGAGCRTGCSQFFQHFRKTGRP